MCEWVSECYSMHSVFLICRKAIPIMHTSQSDRQGLAVLMAYAVVALKHEKSTIRQCHNFIWIDLKFGVSDYVREVSSPAKLGLDPMSGRDATWGEHIRVLWLFFSFLFVYLFFNRAIQPIPVNQFSRTIAQKTRSGDTCIRFIHDVLHVNIYLHFTRFGARKTPLVLRNV